MLQAAVAAVNKVVHRIYFYAIYDKIQCELLLPFTLKRASRIHNECADQINQYYFFETSF